MVCCVDNAMCNVVIYVLYIYNIICSGYFVLYTHNNAVSYPFLHIFKLQNLLILLGCWFAHVWRIIFSFDCADECRMFTFFVWMIFAIIIS